MGAELLQFVERLGEGVVNSSEVCFKHFPRSLLVRLDVTEQPDCQRSWAVGLYAENKQVMSYGCVCSNFFVWSSNVHS